MQRFGTKDGYEPWPSSGGIAPVFRNISWHECNLNEGKFVRFEVFTAVTMKNGVFWVATPCDSCKNGRFGRT
jgi:hypothetical protein